jgi:hypothetical protein
VAHTAGPDPAHVLDLEAWNDLVPGVNWKEMLTDADDKEILAAVRLNTQTGRPLARDSFLGKLEHALGRRPRPLLAGRPKKERSYRRSELFLGWCVIICGDVSRDDGLYMRGEWDWRTT